MEKKEESVLKAMYKLNSEKLYKVYSIVDISSICKVENITEMIEILAAKDFILLKHLDNENVCYFVTDKYRAFMQQKILIEEKAKAKREQEKLLKTTKIQKTAQIKKVNESFEEKILQNDKKDVIMKVDEIKSYTVLKVVGKFLLNIIATFIALMIFYLIF